MEDIDDVNGSYISFGNILKEQESSYLKNNMGTILKEVGEVNKEGKDNFVIKLNGYYKVIAEQVKDITAKNPSDLSTLKVWLTFIQSNTAYLGVDKESRRSTRNSIGKWADENATTINTFDNTEIKRLLTSCTAQVTESADKTDIISTLEKGLDQFIDKYGAVLAKVVDLFGGKGTFMRMMPEFMRDKFLAKFKESNQMTAKQEKDYEVIDGAMFANPNISKEKLVQKGPDGKEIDEKDDDRATRIIKMFKNEGAEDKTATNTILTKNFDKFNPLLVANIIQEYNKKHTDAPLQENNYISFDANHKPLAINKDNQGKTVDGSAVVNALLDPSNSMWSTILATHNTILENSTFNFPTKEKAVDPENINGSKEEK